MALPHAGSSGEPVGFHHAAMTPTPHLIGEPQTARLDNGILARVPGEYVGKAQSSLPDAALVLANEISIDVDAGGLGRVRLTFRKYRYTRPKGKFAAVAWSCRHAERLTSPEA